MHSLKATLSGIDSPTKHTNDPNKSLLKGVNKSKNSTMWALDADVDEAATEQSLQTDNLMRILNDKLQAAYQRDNKALSEINFERIIEEFQDQTGGTKSELSCLLCIEDKLSDILDFAKADYKEYLSVFSQAITNKIAKLKKRDKKTELSNFERIANGNFKKKTKNSPFLNVEQPQVKDKSGKGKIPSKSPKRQESSENKLKRLFSKEKKTVKDRQKGSFARQAPKQQGEAQNATCFAAKDQSVSFSMALATSMAVRSRRRKQSNDFRQPKPRKSENEDDEQKEEGEEAFIFYRPRKGKR